MKKLLYSSLISMILIFSLAISAFAAGSGSMTQDRTESQDRVQTAVDEAEQEQARLQVRDRLQINEQAEDCYQERLQQQDQTGSCFSDTEQHWAREQITSAYNWSLINGYPNGDFNPDGNISGTEGILMASRLMNCLNSDDTETGTESDIDWDLVPAWAREQLREASALKIAAQSQLYGEAQLNRLQFAVMLAEAIGLEPEDVGGDDIVFLDQDEIPSDDLGYINALRTLGIIQGSDGCFYGNHIVTRAEAAAMLTRVLDMLE